MNNPWLSYVNNGANGFHRLDQEICLKFNAGKKKPLPSKHQLRPEFSPLPFFGNHQNAKLVILMANPGLDEENTRLEETAERQALLDQARRHELADNPFVFLRDEFKGTPGYDWWQKRTRELRERVGDEIFLNNTFSAEIHPYKSVNYRPMPERLPTFGYTEGIIRRLMDQGAAVLVRNKDWFRVMPELQNYSRTLVTKNPVISYVTEKSVANNGFAEILKAFSER